MNPHDLSCSSFLHGVYRALNGNNEESSAAIPMDDIRSELSSVILCYGKFSSYTSLSTQVTQALAGKCLGGRQCSCIFLPVKVQSNCRHNH